MNETICGQCKEEYKPKRKKQKYCSAECQRASLKGKPENRSCKNDSCTTEFLVHRKSDPKEYCSRSCAAIVNNKVAVKRNLEGNCAVCNTPISKRLKHCTKHMQKNQIPKKEVYAKKLGEISCFHCKNLFQLRVHNQKFCSTKCLNSYHNRKGITCCTNCNSSITANSRSGLCASCRIEDVKNKKIASWLSGEWRGGTDLGLSETIRKYLLEQANYACCKCGFNTMHPIDGQTVLEVNHIDGNGSNHIPSNLEVICPNCHSLTPNYRGRNLGFGRKVYYLRRGIK